MHKARFVDLAFFFREFYGSLKSYKLQIFPTSDGGIHPRYSPGIGS
ncbi:hypothetical protein SAMN04488519_103121 [Algoriphagus ornithinivorans]|uniref:Uncharacterized protein n=1 Tax=Algoriphagus ornithinivorans TaxID=226506 RepID=A0A1I5DRG4_9BACT|nr:hypothetical protein SAMN04488519_103121 [Algoriphagus ornithinivorans]